MRLRLCLLLLLFSLPLFSQQQSATVTRTPASGGNFTCSTTGQTFSNYQVTWTIDRTVVFGNDVMAGSIFDQLMDICPPPSAQFLLAYGSADFYVSINGPNGPFFEDQGSDTFGLNAPQDSLQFWMKPVGTAFDMQDARTIDFCWEPGNPPVPCGAGGYPLFSVTYYPDESSDLGPCSQCEMQAGYPVNLATGNVWIQQQDYSLPGLGGGMEVTRTWNSMWSSNKPPKQVGLFGDGWTSTYEESLQKQDNGGQRYWSGSGTAWTFSFDSSTSTYTLMTPSDARATLVFSSSTNQYTLTFKDGAQRLFDSNGRLLKVLDRNGNAATLAYDGSGRLSTVTDAAGRVLSFAYSDPANVNQVTGISDAAGTIATYTYAANGVLASTSYPDGSGFTFTSDASTLITAVNDVTGKLIESHTYDSLRRGLTSSLANNVHQVTVSYQGHGNSQLTDSRQNVSSYTSTRINGNRYFSSISGTGCATCGAVPGDSFGYDSSANRTSVTDALGRITNDGYDSNGNVTSISRVVNGTQLNWSYTYNSFGEVLTATDPLGHVTTNTYDTKGNLLTTTTPSPGGKTAGSKTTFAYDTKGQLTQITDPLGHITKITYTAAGLVSTVTDPLTHVTTYGYDARGNRTSVKDALNNTTTFQYDARNRLTKIIKPNQSAISYGYDLRGRRTSVTDANNKITQYAYDDSDRLISVTDANNGITQYAYDTENNLTSITDAALRVTSFTYDTQRRLAQTTFPSTKTEVYGYDAVSNLTSKTDRNGQIINYTYDELHRLTRKQYPDNTAVTYAYDAASRLTQAQDASGTYTFTYDNMDRLTNASSVYSFLAGKTFGVSYTYDAGSNRTGITDPNGGTISYTYDAANRLTTLKDFNRNSFTLGYDAADRTTSLSRPNTVNTTYQYDSASNLLSVLHQKSTTTLDGATYSYDPAGNRTSKSNKLNSVASNFAYDSLYELTGVTQGASTIESYTYDTVGNRLSSLGTPTYSYDSSNELQSAGAASYTYDANGNTLTKTDSSGTTIYGWDFENRLTSVTLPGGTSVTFSYDPFGRRIKKGSSIYTYDGANLIQESDSAGNLVARYVQGPGIDQPLVAYRGSTTEFYEADALGSITSLTTTAGAVNQTYLFDSFGNTTSTTSTFTQPFRYTGREFDSETGLYFYRARYYDPNAGRFLSEDSLGFAGSRANFYAYVKDNPLNFIDPFGLQQTTTAPPTVPNPTSMEVEKALQEIAKASRTPKGWTGLLTAALAAADAALLYVEYKTIQDFNREKAAYGREMQAVSRLNQALATHPRSRPLAGRSCKSNPTNDFQLCPLDHELIKEGRKLCYYRCSFGVVLGDIISPSETCEFFIAANE